MFGGLSISKRYNNVMLDNLAGTGPETVSRNDLWHWNGDWIRPAWTEQTRQRRPATLWPPPWVAPLGWASDADGGELWLVGDSGTVPVRDESSWEQVGSNAVWRFSMHTQTWDRYQLGQAEAAGLWPAPRESASVSSGGWMFGGAPINGRRSIWGGPILSGSLECVGVASAQLKASEQLLSGLWRWGDSDGSVFYQ